MKLYTEEQVRDAIRKRFTARYDKKNVKYYLNTDQVIEELTPIELPSDEEIEDASLEQNNDDLSPAEEFQRGAKYIINKIQGGNDE
jgi:hypothetical protein